jgi:integrase
MPDSTQRKRSRNPNSARPPKPYKDFPLTPHPVGQWCKSINGKVHYFGRWGRRVNGRLERVEGDGWRAAVDLFNEQRDDLYAGRTPRGKSDDLTIADLCNRYLTVKQHSLDTKEIVPRTFHASKRITDRIVTNFGKSRLVDDLAAPDFGELRAEMAKTLGPVSLGNEIQGIRSVFKFAFDEGLIERPVRYGQQFKKPTKKTLRKSRAINGKRMFESVDVRKIMASAQQPLSAMILLGVNCGFGQTDLSSMPQTAVDLRTGWIDYPRPKTGVDRRCPLWLETVSALEAALRIRPDAKSESDSGLCFVTKYGHRWVKADSGSSDDAVAKAFSKLLQQLDLKRPGLNFYALRHTFQTIGEEAGETATRHIMGHVDDSMSAVYRERISDERLKAVTDHVHEWLFG